MASCPNPSSHSPSALGVNDGLKSADRQVQTSGRFASRSEVFRLASILSPRRRPSCTVLPLSHQWVVGRFLECTARHTGETPLSLRGERLLMLTCEQSPKKTTRTRWRRVARSAGHERGVFPSEAVTRNAWSIRAKSERRAKGSLELGETCRRSLVLTTKWIANRGSRSPRGHEFHVSP